MFTCFNFLSHKRVLVLLFIIKIYSFIHNITFVLSVYMFSKILFQMTCRDYKISINDKNNNFKFWRDRNTR